MIAQLNARHSVAVLDLVAQVLVQEKIDILLLQEPPLALERKLWTLAGYRIYLACGEHPLIAILVHSHLCTTFLEFFGDRMAPPGAREVRPVSPPEFAPSRCCRVFEAPDLIDFIIERGYMNLRWSIVPVCQYNPPTFWCATYKRRGSHSTRYHRQTVTNFNG